jgi:metacaspase-1
MAKHALCRCVNDANDWEGVLKNRGFTTVTKLLDNQATGNAIRTAIEAAVTKANSGDIVVIQYSGHGSFVPDDDSTS